MIPIPRHPLGTSLGGRDGIGTKKFFGDKISSVHAKYNRIVLGAPQTHTFLTGLFILNRSEPVLEVHDVVKRYGNRDVLKGLSLAIPPGVTGLLGPNGSGKSTLIKSILGLLRINSGHGRVLSYNWPSECKAIREHIGYLPEDDCYLHGLQGIESIQMMARLSGLPRTEALRRAHEVADFCDIDQERYRNVETYSTGMRQKLKFAQALVHDPPLIILDEPTTGLDPSQRESFLDRIRMLAVEKGKSLIVSTHILHDVQRVCDHVVILVGGEVRMTESLERLQQPIEPGLHLRVEENLEGFENSLRRRGIAFERESDRELRVLGVGADQVRCLWQASEESAAPIQHLDAARNSLEDIFLNAIRS